MATIEQICEVLKAHEEGKIVEARELSNYWVGINPLMCTVTYLQSVELRVKSEPREVWVARGDGHDYPRIFFTLQEVVSWKQIHPNLEVVKFREVTDGS